MINLFEALSSSLNLMEEVSDVQSWDSSWESIYQQQERDKYPSENVIRFIARNYYGAKRHQAIRILDLGCGSGSNLCYLAREGFSVHGIDGSKTAIKRARHQLLSQRLKAHLQVADFISIPYPDGYFDAVIDRQSIQHNKWQNAVCIISEVHRVLHRGGRFLSLLVSTECSGYTDRLRYGGEEIEKHTLVGLQDCTFAGAGLVRFYDEEETKTLMGPFDKVYIGYEKRVERETGFQHSIEFTQWIVEAQKGIE